MDANHNAARSIFFKTFIPILTTLLVLEACFIVFFYFLSAKNVKEQIGSNALALANVVAVLIEQDIDSYKEFIHTLDTDSDYYRRMNENFDTILSSSGDKIVYVDTSIRHSETEIMYIFDGFTDASSPLFVAPGTIDKLSPAGQQAYDKQQEHLGDFGSNVSDNWGDLLSAYVPINDRNGDFLGMVTVQASKRKYRDTLSNLYLFSLVSLAISSIVISLTLGYSLGYIQHKSSIDSLTGLCRRNDLLKRLKRLHPEIKKNNRHAVVFMADLDHFKKINDTYGHPFGDIVLQRLAHVLQGNLRRTDYLVRYGGEEFAGCLTETTMKEAAEVLQRMNKAVANTAIFNDELNKNIYMTISIGYTAFTQAETPDSAIKKADQALYVAKQTRNTSMPYSPKGTA